MSIKALCCFKAIEHQAQNVFWRLKDTSTTLLSWVGNLLAMHILLQTQRVDQESFQELRQNYFVCFPLILYPYQWRKIQSQMYEIHRTWVLHSSICVKGRNRKQENSYLFVCFLQAPQCHPQTVGTSCPTNRWRWEKSKSLVLGPHTAHTRRGWPVICLVLARAWDCLGHEKIPLN